MKKFSSSSAKHMPMRRYHYAIILILSSLLFALFGCSMHADLPEDCEVPVQTTTFSFDKGTYPADLGLFSSYRISPGDVLDVLYQIKREKLEKFRITLYHTVSVKFVDAPQLNETQEVLPNGTIVLPFVGETPVLGKTVSELTRDLMERYSKILRDPELYVTVPEFDKRVKQLREDLHTSPRGQSKLVTVRPDGHVTFPLIGEFLVASKTVVEVIEIIQGAYEDYLPGMKVDLFVHQPASSVVYVLGEVNEPGARTIMRPINSLEAIALAGGHTSKAELDSVIVFRKHEMKFIASRLDLKNLLSLKDQSMFFYLRPDDIIYIPKRTITTLAELMRDIADIAFFRGWGISFRNYID